MRSPITILIPILIPFGSTMATLALVVPVAPVIRVGLVVMRVADALPSPISLPSTSRTSLKLAKTIVTLTSLS